MESWNAIYDAVIDWMNRQPVRPLLFRGHSDANWPLLPRLARFGWAQKQSTWVTEHNAYYDFVTRAGALLPEFVSPWSVAFAMQHYGLATRLLDWSDTFAVALHFAIASGEGDAAVWLLNPFVLNEATIRKAGIFHPNELGADYADYFVHRTATIPGGVAAIMPLRHQERLFSQRGAFTIHGDFSVSLEQRFPDALHKIVIPAALRPAAMTFLQLAGVSEFSLFPDLEGLARDISRLHFERQHL